MAHFRGLICAFNQFKRLPFPPLLHIISFHIENFGTTYKSHTLDVECTEFLIEMSKVTSI